MSNTFLLNSVSRKFCPYYELLQRIFLSLEIHMKVAYHIKENGLQHALAQKEKSKKNKKDCRCATVENPLQWQRLTPYDHSKFRVIYLLENNFLC